MHSYKLPKTCFLGINENMRLCLYMLSYRDDKPTVPPEPPPHHTHKVTGGLNQTGGDLQLSILFIKVFFKMFESLENSHDHQL